ncbi:hypothetical protein ACOTCJ_13850 [Achromobacter xylosoxidans]|nr:hypothetical protein [Achromobacter xylosoxidans]
MIGDLLPSRPEAGYMLARGSAGMVIAAQNKLKEMPRDFNPEKDILSPLRTVEAVWPDYQSENGERITSGLWACRDAVILMRMRMEYMAHGDVQAAKELAAAQNRKSDGCIGALYGINDAGKK